ncbi:MAG: PAS domain S-box protein [Verrucomicrobia bacterium]|nr:PAS domain S-box protein [Verrucomicrobiota bacterium]
MPEDGTLRNDSPPATDERRRRITVAAELALLGALSVLVYGLSAHFDWFDSLAGWIPARRNVRQLHELVYPAVFLIAGLALFALRRWREAEADVRARRQAEEALRRQRDELDVRVGQRTAELREANDTLRAEAVQRCAAEEAGRASDSRLRLLAEHIQDVFWLSTPAIDRIIYVSPAYEKIWGRTCASVYQRPQSFVEAIHPEDQGRVIAAFAEHAQGNWDIEYRIIQPDGAVRWILDRGFPIRDDGGDLIYMCGVAKDVTARKQAEAALHASEERFRVLFEQAAVGVALIRSDTGQFVQINRKYCDITGYSREEMERLTSQTITHPDDLPADLENKTLLTTGKIREFTMEKRYVRKDGSPVWVNLTVSPMWAPDAPPSFHIAVVRDITTRKQAEAQVRLFRELLNQSGDSIFVVDPATSRITDVNESAYRLLNYSRDELLQRGMVDIQTALRDAAAWQAHVRQLEAQGPMLLEFEGRRKDGTLVPVEVSARHIVVAGRPHILAVLRDITARRQAQEALRQSAQRLRLHVEQAPLGVIEWDLAFRVTKWNPASERLFGYTSAEALGQPASFIVPEAARVHVDGVWQALLEQKGGHRSTNENVCKDGRSILCEWYNTPLVDAAGNVVGVASLIGDVTERKRAEMALQESESRFRQLANSLPQLVWTCQADGPCDFLSQRWVDFTGIPEAKQLGFDWLQQLHPDDRAPTVAAWQAAVASGADFRVEFRIRRHDGEYRWFDTQALRLRDAGGHTVKWFGSNTDITGRKHAEEALQRSYERFDLVACATKDVIWDWDLQTNLLWWNDNYQTMFGYSKEETVPGIESWVAFIHPDDSERVLAGIHAAIDGGRRHWSDEYRFRRRDGQYAQIFDRGFVVWDAKGKGIRMIGAMTDITARKQAEVALQQSEERYRLLFDDNPLPMFLHDVESPRLLAVNESAVQLYGYTREEFRGMADEQICHPEDVPVLRGRIAQDRTGSGSSGELRHRRKDGAILHVETFSRPVTFGGCRARLVLVHDLTEKKLLEGKFLHAQRLESIGMLASGIAHDLNNVLAPIVFAAPMLRKSLATPRDLKILDTLERSAERGTGLVKQILGFAHSATGEFGPIQVKHIARDIVSVIEETFPKSIQLENRIQANLWPVQGNATQIHQVLMNLCVNARDAMPAGGTLRLVAANHRLDAAAAGAISGARPGDWLVLEVGDTGTGIAPDTLAHLWEPFFTTKPKGKGTGLGLSTIRGIVASHQGFVELDTTVGRGTTFRVFLPALESGSPRPGSGTPLAVPDSHGELLLVVDDDALIRDLATEILTQHGYRVVCCVDGIDAITVFGVRSSEISLVITDVDMPRLGGLALARAVLQMHPGIRLLAMSGWSRNYTGNTDVPEIRNLAHEFLDKPFKADELLGAVHQLLHPPQKP